MEHKYINYKNTKIHYFEKGKGSTLIFLHGFLENLNMWNPFLATYTSKHRVIAIDLLGHGKSEPMGYIHTMEDMADCIFALIQELKLRKVTLIGHSMGGYVALAFAELYPDYVKALLLIASTSQADSPTKRLNRDRAIELIKKNHTSFINIAISNLFDQTAKDLYNQEIQTAKTEALKMPVQGIIATLEGMKIRADREVLLHFAPYPILFILGQKDTIMPYEQVKVQLQDTPTELNTLSGGHMLHIENTTELNTSIANYVKKHKL